MITRGMTRRLQEGKEASSNGVKPKPKAVFRMRLRSSNKAWLRKKEEAKKACLACKKKRSKHAVPVEKKKKGPLTLTEILERNAAKQKAKDMSCPLTKFVNLNPESPWDVLKKLWQEHLGQINDPNKEFSLNSHA
ncbi:hypothetical protein Aduo_019521 [Ancylostoma duodenale]